MEIVEKCLEKFREYRTKKFSKIGQALYSIGISANIMTFLSLILGLTAVYFLFSNYYLFAAFALLHLLADGIDGVIARVSKTASASKNLLWGKYFDSAADSLVTLLLLVKIGWHLQDYYAYIVAGLFLITVMIHYLSEFAAPVLFIRTVSLILLAIFTFPLIPYQKILLTIIYLTAGTVSAYSLARQLQWFLNKKIYEK